jgi:hypothetical protein
MTRMKRGFLRRRVEDVEEHLRISPQRRALSRERARARARERERERVFVYSLRSPFKGFVE